MSDPGSTTQRPLSQSSAAHPIELRLNWELAPWGHAVLDNLRSALQPEAPAPALTFRPGVFWKDVFVDQRLNWRSIIRSYAGHAAFAGLVYVISMPLYWQRFAALETFHHDRITYVNPEEDVIVSEPVQPQPEPPKLAPIISRSSKAPLASTGEPRKRVVEAIAVPKWADNTMHTIVAPTAPKILASAPVPDIVLLTPVPQAPPVAAVASNAPKLIAPVLEVTPVAPPPDVTQAHLHMPAMPQAAAIAPPVVTNRARDLASLNIAPAPEAVNAEPKLPVAASRTVPLAAVEPIAPSPDLKDAGAAPLAKALPGMAQPIAPPPDLKTVAGGVASKLPGTAEPIAPPPDLSGAGTASSAAGSLISLNVTPIAGPPRVPDGTRRGAFAGTPEAKTNGSAIPDRQGGGTGPGGDSPVATKDELGIVAAAVPHGTAGGTSRTPAEVITGTPGSGSSLLALARAPHGSLPPPKVATVVDQPTAVDERVFRGRKYYTMALNTPNLTSAGGSWIFRFAERGGPSKPGDVTAPIAVREVDPAYPADLIRENVQGIVILYAVIRSDGTVAEVKVLEGFDDRLDENARKALSAWQFVPGTRNGNPVDLEAVVRIPFRSKRVY